jgi:hypothetical protein
MACEHQYVSTQKTKFITAGGLFGALMFLIGIFAFIASPLIGVALIIGGIVVSIIGRKGTIIMCAKCGERAPHQPG